MTALNRKSKHDTVLLTDEEDDIFVDVSQERTNLTDNTTYFTEEPSARTALSFPRDLTVKLRLRDGDSGTALYHGDGGITNYTYRMRVNGATLEGAENGALRVTCAIPDLDAGEDRTYLLHWAQRSSGSSAYSEMMVYCYDTGAYEFGSATHTTGTTDTSWDFVLNGTGGGAGVIANTFLGVHVGRRFHSTAEVREDWIDQTTPPSTSAIRRRTTFPTRSSLLPFGEGTMASQYLMLAANTRDSDRRLISPIVNLRTNQAVMRNTWEPVAWWRASPVTAGMHLTIALLWRAPLNSSRARVRIFVHQDLAIGDDPDTAPVRYQMHCLKNLPTLLKPDPGELVTKVGLKVTCTTKHGMTSDGEWLDLGQITLLADNEGCTWLALGISIDDDDVNDLADDTMASVKSVTIEPYNVPEADNQNKKGP